MSKILLDTNVLIYALDGSSSFYENARKLLENEDFSLYVATKNISEYFAVCSKLDFAKENIWGFYNEVKENCQILIPTYESIKIFEQLLQKYEPRGNRIYDVEIVSLMLDNNIKQVATANFSDFKHITEVEIFEIH